MGIGTGDEGEPAAVVADGLEVATGAGLEQLTPLQHTTVAKTKSAHLR